MTLSSAEMTSPFSLKIPETSLSDCTRFERAVAHFDTINCKDPNALVHEGAGYPAEYLLAQALCHWVLTLSPDPSESLLLASRCQHLRRWEHPRSAYPAGRAGYLKWRADLKHIHAEHVTKLLRAYHYDPRTIAAVRSLNLKEDLKKSPDCQILEDGLCLVFLQFQFEEILARYPDEKVISILQKTARKMSTKGLAAAGELNYSPRAQALLSQALGNQD